MKLLRDPLGRPIKRLYFKAEELDEECERIIREFMDRRSGGFRVPIPTDEIIRMSRQMRGLGRVFKRRAPDSSGSSTSTPAGVSVNRRNLNRNRSLRSY